MTQTVLYLHGFLSGPGSKKACVLRDLCEAKGANFVAPDLNMSPEDAASLIWSEYEKATVVGEVAVAGASLGGFYAAWLAGRTGIRAALLNPAVEPWDIVKLYNGEYKSFTADKIVRVTPDYADQLRALDAAPFADPTRVLMVLCTGDEVLDWRRAATRFSDVQSIVIDGSDHRISCFEEYAAAVRDFLLAGSDRF